MPKLRVSSLIALILDSVIVKGIIWAGIPLALLHGAKETIVPIGLRLFTSRIPLLPCLIAVCLSAAFLNTVRMLNGLMNTHIIFDFGMIVLSVTAGVFEEIGFRGCMFNAQQKSLGFLPAAAINGLMFVLFHYPGLIVGDISGILSLRSLMIFIVGVLFCWMFKQWKSLPMLMIVHVAWDIMSYLFCLV